MEQLSKLVENERDRYIRTLKLQAQMDERELERMKEDRNKFLQKSIENYVKCLQAGVRVVCIGVRVWCIEVRVWSTEVRVWCIEVRVA